MEAVSARRAEAGLSATRWNSRDCSRSPTQCHFASRRRDTRNRKSGRTAVRRASSSSRTVAWFVSDAGSVARFDRIYLIELSRFSYGPSRAYSRISLLRAWRLFSCNRDPMRPINSKAFPRRYLFMVANAMQEPASMEKSFSCHRRLLMQPDQSCSAHSYWFRREELDSWRYYYCYFIGYLLESLNSKRKSLWLPAVDDIPRRARTCASSVRTECRPFLCRIPRIVWQESAG